MCGLVRIKDRTSKTRRDLVKKQGELSCCNLKGNPRVATSCLAFWPYTNFPRVKKRNVQFMTPFHVKPHFDPLFEQVARCYKFSIMLSFSTLQNFAYSIGLPPLSNNPPITHATQRIMGRRLMYCTQISLTITLIIGWLCLKKELN